MKKTPMAKLPSVDTLLSHPACDSLIKTYGKVQVTDFIREHLSELRQQLMTEIIASPPDNDQLFSTLGNALQAKNASPLTAVINLTGTVLHTNLGRAIWPEAAVQAMVTAATNTTNLEYDLNSANRGDRDQHIEKLIMELTGGEAATLVNNNAAAVLLVLNSLALHKEVPVSRGELVEIGGSFRIPDVMTRAGCQLIEVGTTNRTHLKDYANAINTNTALLMKVHTSNYQIKGFTKSVSEKEIAGLARERSIPFVTDLGSGTLIDLRNYGLPYEPTASEAIQNGADLVTFSGDKLLGGPQAGIIVGKKELIATIKANPLKRALRVDKVTIAALVEVLKLYKDPDTLQDKLPTLRHLSRSIEKIRIIADKLIPSVAKAFEDQATVKLEPVQSQIGSGSLPLDLLPSLAISLEPSTGKQRDQQLSKIVSQFRNLPVPVIGRVHDGKLLLDLRCLDDTDLFLNQLSHLPAI